MEKGSILNMKTLETIQKTCKVFYTLAKIAMSLSFVWAGLNAIGVICCTIWHCIGEMPTGFLEEIWLDQYGDLLKTIGILTADFVFGVTDGILFFFAARYLKQELADGTPFTLDGSKQVMSLGIKTIVMPLVAVIICAIIYACFDLSQYNNLSNASSVVLGVALILVSLILRHGAELKEENENDEEQNL